jgi:hypothetical protein
MNLEAEPTNHQLDKRLSLVEQTVTNLHADLKSINQILRWIAMMLGSGLIGALLNFVIKGGLSHV